MVGLVGRSRLGRRCSGQVPPSIFCLISGGGTGDLGRLRGGGHVGMPGGSVRLSVRV